MRDGLARPVTRSQPDALNGVATTCSRRSSAHPQRRRRKPCPPPGWPRRSWTPAWTLCLTEWARPTHAYATCQLPFHYPSIFVPATSLSGCLSTTAYPSIFQSYPSSTTHRHSSLPYNRSRSTFVPREHHFLLLFCCLTFLLTRYSQEPLFEQGTFIAAAQEYSSPSFGLWIATPDSYSPTDLDGSHHQPTSNAYIISIPIWQSSDHPKLLSSHSENIFLCLRSSYDSGARPPLSIQALRTTSRIRPTSLRRT